MRFRQIHLDFHTSEAIPDIGKNFSKQNFQDMLKLGHVDSITVFSKCHHGWAYHPSEANEMHPGLAFDLLGAQIEACHEIGVKTPVYISAGLDEKQARRRPDWLLRDQHGNTNWVETFLNPGYHQFCMNTPYLDMLVAQIEEVVQRYDADGIFLDIVGVRTCVCNHCIRTLLDEGRDPQEPSHVLELGERTYANYARRTNEAVHKHKPGLPVFHNGGHIRQGRRDLAHFNTHLELESLPTGGWGYDHFPLSARYVQGLGMDFLGMTGKFHTTWGEFGGYKHPNALRYEAALSVANGAHVSIGDQLHPRGEMDEATYRLIGAAYKEVEQKEKYCVDAVNIADVALLSEEANAVDSDPGLHPRAGRTDAGAVRMLLEGKILFDVVDLESDFSPYKVIILPDNIRISDRLKAKIDPFLANGGKLLATGESGLNTAQNAFVLPLGVRSEGPNPYNPDFFRPHWPLANLGPAAFVFYGRGQRISLEHGGTVLGSREDPYFNREFDHFCSHLHTPSNMEASGPGMVESAAGIYIAWRVFEDYATKGSLALKETVLYALNRLLDGRKTLETDLPAQGIVTLTEQKEHGRYVHHLLYASPVKRGEAVEIIEDILPINNVELALRLPRPAKAVSLAPQGQNLAFSQEGGVVRCTVPTLECHQMVVIDY